jgi:hypothetical protein
MVFMAAVPVSVTVRPFLLPFLPKRLVRHRALMAPGQARLLPLHLYPGEREREGGRERGGG